MYYAYQDRENLYLCMDMLSGGDLRYHINKRRKFTEEQTKFFVACML
jgi:serine/threonine protein kinase